MNIFYNNKHTLHVFLISLIFLFGENGIAQTQNVSRISKSDSLSTISGRVTDKDTGEEMIAANIQVFKNGNFIQGETTDIDGNYLIQVDSGKYDLAVSYTGYVKHKITGIIVSEERETKVDVQITAGVITDYPIYISGCGRLPIIQQDKTASGKVMEISEDIFKKLPTRNINEMIMLAPGVTFGN